VEREFETAIETALGGSAQNIITQTEDDAKHAIEFLKEHNKGRATFLPLSAVKGKNIDASVLKNEQGFLGIAAELTECAPLYMPIVSFILGDVIIIDTLENALVLHKKYDYAYKFVTKSGERLSPGGAITGGSSTRQSAGIIGRSRRLEQLKNEVEALQRTVDDLCEKQAALNEKRSTTREALNTVREKASFLQLEQQNLTNKLSDTQEALQNLNQLSASYNEENETIMTRLVTANGETRAAKAELAEKENALEAARAALENYQKEIEQNRQEHTEEADTLTELRVEISRREDRITHANQSIERLQKETATLTEEKRLILAEISANESASQKAKQDHTTQTQELAKKQSQMDEVRAALSKSEADKTKLDTAISQTEAEERTQTDATALLEREIARLEARKENLDASSHRLHNEIWEEYSLTYQTAASLKRDDLTDSALRKAGQALKAELSQMTNVNIGAIEAYKQMKTRHGFLTTQRDDILGAEAALDELIQNLTTQMESQFAEKFAEIAAHFQDVFKEMFDGGKARLRILDSDNVLESGIEIIAQPPGKSLQNLMLLSGGERALTAIALLFAILRMKPSPFCVLDEIESALDDANVTRFANFLKLYAEGTQFLIITHRKGTMEAADNLYGVTMEEQGISKLVSVKFVD
jgi:chromosome segregation protein